MAAATVAITIIPHGISYACVGFGHENDVLFDVVLHHVVLNEVAPFVNQVESLLQVFGLKGFDINWKT